MKLNRDAVEKVGVFLSKEGAMTVARVLVGVLLGATMGLEIAPLAVAAISVAVVGLTAVAHTSIERQKKETLLDTYREEISQMLGKDDKSLTLQDLQRVAKSPENPNGSTALAMALDYFRHTRNFFIGSQAATAGLMILGLAVISSTFGNAPTLGLAGAAGLLYNELFRTVTNIGSLVIDQNIKGTITNEISEMNKEISIGGRISAARVMGVLVSVNPKLKAKIEAHFNQPYDELSIADKRDVVNQLNAETRVVQLTKDINMGYILPTELAFIAFGESSGTPRREVAPEIVMEHGYGDLTHWQDRVKTVSGFNRNNELTDHVSHFASDDLDAMELNGTALKNNFR